MSRQTISLVSVVLAMGLACSAYGVQIGDFEGNTMDGWTVSATNGASAAPSTTGATLGKGSLKISAPTAGWSNCVLYSILTNNKVDDFRKNKYVLADITRLTSEWTGEADGHFSNIFFIVNAGGDGWTGIWVQSSEVAAWSNSDGDQAKTFAFDYTDGLSQVPFDKTIWWMEIFVCVNWGGYASGGIYYLDNVRLVNELTPSTATNPKPGAGQTDVPRDGVLSWKPGVYAKTHDVYFGTSSAEVSAADANDTTGVLVAHGQDANTYDPAGLLEFGRTYFWRIDDINAPSSPGLHKGDVWSFTVETYAYPVKLVKATASSSLTGMGPEKTIDGSGLTGEQHGVSAAQMWLSKKGQSPIWIQYEFDAVYKLYQMWVWNSNQEVEPAVGFGAKDVVIETSTDGTTWRALDGVPEFAQAPGEPNYVHNTTVDLGGSLAKYVKLTITSNWADGTKQAGLSEVRFFYIPLRAREPQPASGATGMALDGVLSWRPGREAARHEVSVSADPNAVLQGTAPVSTVVAHSLDLGPLGLEYARTYTWRVNEVNDAATPPSWTSDVWNFSTIGYRVVDDFEDYNDACNRIFFIWQDGAGHNGSTDCSVAPFGGNGTGSTVGNANAPFAEGTIVHSGGQSMPLSYDNAKSPFYSETQREWTVPQAWTGGGVNTLVVYVRGDAAAFLETSPGTLIMNGTGTDIWANSDQLRFAYKSLKGNGSIVARVDSVSNTNGWAKAGVMIRETTQAGSANGVVAVTPGNGITFQWRATTDDVSSNVGVTGFSAPYWVKLTRTGTTLTAQYSGDGAQWTDLTPTTAPTFTMASDVYIGLAVTSHASDVVCGAKFSNVSTTGSVSGSWQVAEIGVSQSSGNLPETFYVALQDNAGSRKVVSNPDTGVIASGAWQEWDVPLTAFTSAGVNLGSIKKMVIGVGVPSAPKMGGAGKLYIDDIRLARIAAP